MDLVDVEDWVVVFVGWHDGDESLDGVGVFDEDVFQV